MNNKNINIKLKKNGNPQYLTEILPQIPTNCILYKKLTGLGATYNELKAKRNSIIIEPNKPVIEGKCKDSKHKNDNLFGVFEGIYREDITKYIEKSKGKFFKVMTTPESFKKVKEAFDEMDIDIRYECFLLFDECHKIVKDVDYRQDITLPMDYFFECQNKALVSATPIEFTDPRFDKQGFQTITLNPTFEYVKDIKLYTTNNVLPTIRTAIQKVESENIFIFCNSTDAIHELMKTLNLTDNSSVFCSEKSVAKLKSLKFKSAFSTWNKKEMKKYNWMTSRFFNALDIELDTNPVVIMVTDCYFAEFTTIDPYTDAVQIIGRFRNGVKDIYHISNTNRNFQKKSKEEIMGYVNCSEKIYLSLTRFYKSASNQSAKDAYRAAIDCLPFNRMLDGNKNKNYFAIDNFVNEELLKGYYKNSESLYEAYRSCESFNPTQTHFTYTLGDSERLKRTNKSISIKEKRKIIVEQLELLGKCQTEMELDYKRDLMATDAFIVNAYDTIGKEMIEQLNYSYKKINEKVILTQYRERSTGTEVIKLIKNSFQAGQWYSAQYIKKEIQRIHNELGITSPETITSHTITEFFEAYEKEKTINKKKQRGYQLVNCRF